MTNNVMDIDTADLRNRAEVVIENILTSVEKHERVPQEMDMIALSEMAAEAVTSNCERSQDIFEELCDKTYAVVYDDNVYRDPKFNMGIVYGIMSVLKSRDSLWHDFIFEQLSLEYVIDNISMVRLLAQSDGVTIDELCEASSVERNEVLSFLVVMEARRMLYRNICGKRVNFCLTRYGHKIFDEVSSGLVEE